MSARSEDSRVPEVPRDQDTTGFSRHLDVLLRQVPDALCAVFVDGEGETVDLATRIDGFESRIVGAEVAVLLAALRASQGRLKGGEPLELRVEGTTRSFVARTVCDGYDLVVLVGAPQISARAAELTAATAISLLVEAGMKPPPSFSVLRSVEMADSALGGASPPRSFEESGKRRRVESVLGYRQEGDGVHYLVRLDDGEELVMVHEPATGRWRKELG